MDIYVARQPIFDIKKCIFGYELLFRADMANFFPEMEGDSATSKLLSNSFFNIGIEKIAGSNLAFINFTQELLLKQLPLMFSQDRLVVEILENVQPDRDVIEACQEIALNGYIIVLDDFFYKPSLEPLIEVADIIKIDVKATPLEEVGDLVRKMTERGVDLLAEKVETHDEFKKALKMGFRYFQGFFFSKPEVLAGKEISTPQMQLLEIMAEVNKEDFEFNRLEKMIVRDASISYKLMRLINSAYFKRAKEISSIRQAIVMIGEVGIRRFLSLISMAGLAGNKPDELIRVSLVRAKFCELLGNHPGRSSETSELFTLGLFSLIDAIMDDSMENLMSQIPLSSNIKEVLISRTGDLSGYLSLVESYERGDWGEIEEATNIMGIDQSHLPRQYMESLSWADSLNVLQ
ncbi:MAG: HDOD domain-containing protein [Desulfobacteraceae bacterium]|nr:HDOD domain-containing protein [Desulfobacteraceae bacterium]